MRNNLGTIGNNEQVIKTDNVYIVSKLQSYTRPTITLDMEKVKNVICSTIFASGEEGKNYSCKLSYSLDNITYIDLDTSQSKKIDIKYKARYIKLTFVGGETIGNGVFATIITS